MEGWVGLYLQNGLYIYTVLWLRITVLRPTNPPPSRVFLPLVNRTRELLTQLKLQWTSTGQSRSRHVRYQSRRSTVTICGGGVTQKYFPERNRIHRKATSEDKSKTHFHCSTHRDLLSSNSSPLSRNIGIRGWTIRYTAWLWRCFDQSRGIETYTVNTGLEQPFSLW